MKKTLILTTIITIFLIKAGNLRAEEKTNIVIEESYYVVKPENKEKFLKIYKEKLYPFWHKMYEMGILVDDYRLYTQRIHTAEPEWTYKTVAKFKNYAAIDLWLKIRDKEYRKLFPEEEGYSTPRKQINMITEKHWDEFIKEVPLK